MDFDLNVGFDIYNKESVKLLQETDPDILPTYSVAESKDLSYNKKQVNNAITSAIIQGKSIDGIADDLQSRISSLNRNSAVAAARTGITCAQNAGSLSSMKELAATGVEVQKEWVATLDDRTRESHRMLDGERRGLDECFSNGLMYPGASGSASETWRCRCTMTSYLPDVDTSDAVRWSRNPSTGKKEYVPEVKYSEWIKAKTSKKAIRLRKINLFSKSDPLYIETFSIEEEDGFTDVCIHGDNYSVQMEINGTLKNFTAEEFAEYLKKSGLYNGGDIRLAACCAGKGSNSFAQRLSKILEIRVKAADDDVYFIPEDGAYFIGSPHSNDGNWRIFNNGEEE